MNSKRAKFLAAVVGGGAAVVSMVVGVTHDGTAGHSLAGGSGDSSIVTYTQPTIPQMAFDPTAMSMGATATAATPAPTLATEMAAPTMKATAAATCVNNGQCP